MAQFYPSEKHHASVSQNLTSIFRHGLNKSFLGSYSHDLFDIICKVLQKDPKQRISAKVSVSDQGTIV